MVKYKSNFRVNESTDTRDMGFLTASKVLS